MKITKNMILYSLLFFSLSILLIFIDNLYKQEIIPANPLNTLLAYLICYIIYNHKRKTTDKNKF